MKVRGVSFKIPQWVDDILEQIMKCINVLQYYWYNEKSQEEIWSVPSYDDFFEKNLYDGISFYKKIKQPHKVLFLKLQAYPNMIKVVPNNIDTFEDFVNSNCELLILIYDGAFVEIFSKKKEEVFSLFQNAENNGFSDVKLITKENDERVNMNIL